MTDTLYRRMVVADTINWFKKLWFCRMTGIHRSKFTFVHPQRAEPGQQFYPSFKCELCDRNLFH